MLAIRQEQLKAFADAAAKKIEDHLASRLRESHARECAALDDNELSQVIREGIERAAKYGIAGDSGVAKYLYVMLALGRDFDRDPRFTWASRILNDESLESADARIDRLYAAALEQTDEAKGRSERKS